MWQYQNVFNKSVHDLFMFFPTLILVVIYYGLKTQSHEKRNPLPIFSNSFETYKIVSLEPTSWQMLICFQKRLTIYVRTKYLSSGSPWEIISANHEKKKCIIKDFINEK